MFSRSVPTVTDRIRVPALFGRGRGSVRKPALRRQPDAAGGHAAITGDIARRVKGVGGLDARVAALHMPPLSGTSRMSLSPPKDLSRFGPRTRLVHAGRNPA